MNTHTPFKDLIRESNLCLEIALPTKAYVDMKDLYGEKSVGETAFCSLSAFNVSRITFEEYAEIAELGLEAVDIMIDRAPMMSDSMAYWIQQRRSVGIGITGLAERLYNEGMDYDGSEESLNLVQKIAEHHYFHLLKASQKLAKRDRTYVEGIKEDWLPIDSSINKSVTELDWESLRGHKRKHSVLSAHMPTECQVKTNEVLLADGTVKSLGQILIESKLDVDGIENSSMAQGQRFKIPEIEFPTGKCDEVYYNGLAKVYEIEFEDGNTYKFTANHRLLVNRNGQNEYIFVKDLTPMDDIVSM
jgi:ribonucleotide reductase alpha subunit